VVFGEYAVDLVVFVSMNGIIFLVAFSECKFEIDRGVTLMLGRNIGDKFKILVTVLAILVNNIQKLSQTVSHQDHCCLDHVLSKSLESLTWISFILCFKSSSRKITSA